MCRAVRGCVCVAGEEGWHQHQGNKTLPGQARWHREEEHSAWLPAWVREPHILTADNARSWNRHHWPKTKVILTIFFSPFNKTIFHAAFAEEGEYCLLSTLSLSLSLFLSFSLSKERRMMCWHHTIHARELNLCQLAMTTGLRKGNNTCDNIYPTHTFLLLLLYQHHTTSSEQHPRQLSAACVGATRESTIAVSSKQNFCVCQFLSFERKRRGLYTHTQHKTTHTRDHN